MRIDNSSDYPVLTLVTDLSPFYYFPTTGAELVLSLFHIFVLIRSHSTLFDLFLLTPLRLKRTEPTNS